MAKKKSGSGINFKQILLQKGERYGFYAAAALLVLFACAGGFKAAGSKSTSTIVGDFDKGVKQVNQKISRKPGDDPAPLSPVIYDDSTVARIPFTKYTVEHNLYDITSNEQTKRLNPRILSPNAAQVDFVRGSVEVYDIIEQPDGKRVIAVITQREKKNNVQNKVIPKRITAGSRPKPPAPPPQQANQQPGAVPPPPGGMAGPRGRGLPGAPGGGVGAQNVKSTETAVEYKDVTSKDIDAAQLAETILPQRMVVVTCTIPYRQQVEEYRRALRAAKVADLSELPEYRGYVVERRVISLDGKTVEQDWTDLDVKGTLKNLYSRTIDFEPENPPNELAADLKTLYPRLLPPEEFELLLPRPKLYRGEYPGVNLKTVTEALQTLVAKGEKAVELRTQTQNLIDDTNPFHRAGTGAGGGLQSGAPLPGGKTGVPPGGRFLPGAPPTGPGTNNQAQQRPEDEDAWLMRFIDTTCEAGHLYQYRVALKALNPNYQKPAKELAVPQLAEKEFLQSEFFEIPTAATVPPEEYLYAASRNDRQKNHDTEKMPAPGLWDETWLQMQRWYDFIRPDGFSRAEPFGEWLVADLKVFRGQYVGEKLLLPLPIWSMENAMFLFRDNPARTRRGPSIRAETGRQSDPNWSIDLYPTPPVLLVDFEGGSGQYYGPRHSPIQGGDVAGVEMLLLSADGKLRVARSGQDFPDADRNKRETGWTQWQEKVNADTLATKMGNTGGGPGDLGGRRDR